MPMTMDKFETPLYTLAEASQYLGLADSTFHRWAKGYSHKSVTTAIQVTERPVLTVVAGRRPREASVPFVGLAEGLVLAAIRNAGVPLQRIRAAVDALQTHLGITHVLASKSLYTDGAEVLYDFAEPDQEAGEVNRLVVVRSGQHAFSEVVQQYLRRIDFGIDGYAQTIELPGYSTAKVLADPSRGFGQPIFQRGGARVEDALGLFLAGQSLAQVSAEYGVPEAELEDALRVATKHAA